ncbi:MAG: class I SAM-dependent methyltransferase, partial [Desulfocucumaceae bacterium]
KDFPHQSEIKKIFERLGLKEAAYNELTGGIVTVHEGTV